MNEQEQYDQALHLMASKLGRGPVLIPGQAAVFQILPPRPFDDPNTCARCGGAGFLVDRRPASYGQLVACDACDKATMQTIARCWSVSAMEQDARTPPTLTGMEPYSQEADVAIAMITDFVTERFGWLTLTGGPGTGKSHALEAIARYFLTTGLPCVYLSSRELWEYLGGVTRGKDDDHPDYAERYTWIANLPALVIDELNVETSSAFVFKSRRSLLDHRYRAALQGESVTVLASNDYPAAWQDGAVADRALDTRFRSVFTGTKSYRQVKRGAG